MSKEADSIFNQGCLAFDAGNFELAERQFAEAIALDPTNKIIRLNKGHSLARQGKLDDAFREYDRLLELFPDCGLAWTIKAMMLNHGGLFAEAEMCAENALRLSREDSEAWGQKGFALERQHKLDEAMMCYEEQIRLSPAEGWESKGRLLLMEYCDYENAISCFDKALQLNAQNMPAWAGKGTAYSALGLYDEAIKCYDYLEKAFPDNPAVWTNMGVVLTFQGKFEEAEKYLLTATELMDTCSSLGYLYLLQGKFQEALQWFDEALEEENDELAAQGKALCEYLTTNPRPPMVPDPTGKSLQEWSKLYQTKLYFYRGKTLVIFGEVEEAKKAYEKCLELNPNYKAAAMEMDKIRQLRKRKERST